MKEVRKLWIPVLLGTSLMTTLVGVAGARPNARPEASPQLRNHMISAHHCMPMNNTTDWEYLPSRLQCNTAACDFFCPINPPHEGLIRVQRLAMYVFDNGTGKVCIWLEHVYPKTGTNVERLTNQCTTDNGAVPQVYSYNPANFKVSELQDLCTYVWFSGTTQKVYGLKLRYEPL